MKKCNICHEIKELTQFHKQKSIKCGRRARCRECCRLDKQNNKEKIKITGKKYYENNKEKIKIAGKKWYEDNKEQVAVYNKQWRKDNEEKLKIIGKKYYKDNKEKIVTNMVKYKKKKYKDDDLYRLRNNISSLIRSSFKLRGWKKNSKAQTILGCDFDTLLTHLTQTFENRYGINIEDAPEKLHIDHIIPSSSAKTIEDIIQLNHYTNLQYLTQSDNLSKSDKLDWQLP